MMNNNNRFRQQNLMRQGQQMLASQQQQDFNNWYDIGSSIGNGIFGSMAGATSDGQYEGEDLTKRAGYDKNMSDKQNWQNMQAHTTDYTDTTSDSASPFYDNAPMNADGTSADFAQQDSSQGSVGMPQLPTSVFGNLLAQGIAANLSNGDSSWKNNFNDLSYDNWKKKLGFGGGIIG